VKLPDKIINIIDFIFSEKVGLTIMFIALMMVFILMSFSTFFAKSPLCNTRIIKQQDINVYCDKDTNIEYLIYHKDDIGGITVRYNSNGKPKKCK